MLSYHSWVGELQTHPSALTSTNNQKLLFCGHSVRDSLPKLHLNKFDGDPLHWSDWSSIFKSIVHDANLSLNGKMQHLQNSVIERAKSAIEGYGYNGDSYYETLNELESRFGIPSLVVKVTLDRLRKQHVYKMTNFKKLGTYLMLCQLLCGLSRSLDMKVI